MKSILTTAVVGSSHGQMNVSVMKFLTIKPGIDKGGAYDMINT
jgi:hypothetical protein